jgi:hypothetical protein
MLRLVLICLVGLTFAQLLPAAARANHRPSSPCAACPPSQGHDSQCGDRGCIGCALEPDPSMIDAPWPERRTAPALARRIAAPSAYRPGFDPPPPRTAG